MNTAPNILSLQPYGTVDPQESVYIIRPADDELFNYLRRGEPCNVLCSRQMGKTSLIKRTQLRLFENSVGSAYVELIGYLGTPYDRNAWYQDLLQEIADQLGLHIDVPAWWQADRSQTHSRKLMQFCRNELATKLTAPVVIFLDEIDVALDEIDLALGVSVVSDLFLTIRSMYNDRVSYQPYKNITFCLAGVATPNELIERLRITPFNIGRNIELSDFAIEQLALLSQVVAHRSSDLKLGKDIITEVIRWTGGQPYLTMRVCEAFVKKECMSPDDVEKIVNQVFTNLEELQIEPHFEFILRFLSRRVEDKLTTLNLYRRVLNGEVVRDGNTPAYTALKLMGIVKRDRHGILVVRNPIYQRIFNNEWVESITETDAQREKITALTVEAQKYEEILRRGSSDYRAAIAAYQNLRSNPAYTGNVDQRLAGYLGERAKQAEQGESIEESLLWRLNALVISPTPERARHVSVMAEGYSAQQEATTYSQGSLLKEAASKVRAVALSANGRRILSCSNDGTARLWDAGSGRLLHQLTHHDGRIHAAAISPDGEMAITCGDFGLTSFWNANTGQRLSYASFLDESGGQQGSIRSVAFSKDSKLTLAGSDGGTVYLRSVNSKQMVRLFPRHSGAIVWLGFSPEGRKILSADAGGTAQLWDVITGSLTGQPMEHKSVIWAAAFSPDGKIVVTGSDDGEARLWDADSGSPISQPLMHDSWISSVAFSPDGRIVLTGSNDRTVRLWRADSGQPTGQEIRHKDSVKFVTFSLDGKTILSVTSSWVHAAQFEEEEIRPIGSRYLFGNWQNGGGIRFLDPSANQTQVAVVTPTGSVRSVVLQFDWPSAEPVQGDPKALLEEWQQRLGKYISEDGEVIPLPRGDTGKSRVPSLLEKLWP